VADERHFGPGTQVVSVSGDGGFLMSAMELETARRLGCTFTHVLMRDEVLNMVEFQQLATRIASRPTVKKSEFPEQLSRRPRIASRSSQILR
jgi:thiamine pyrophosphate-dependent acetolactate synthase large subunit-like protein